MASGDATGVVELDAREASRAESNLASAVYRWQMVKGCLVTKFAME